MDEKLKSIVIAKFLVYFNSIGFNNQVQRMWTSEIDSVNGADS